MDDSQRNLSSNNGRDSEPMNPNGLRAFQTLGQFLEQDGWFPQKVDDKYIYRASFSGKNGDFRCYAHILVNLEQFLFYAVAASRVPEDVRPAVAEFITRANYGMRIGNFELDYSDGEVRYKTSLDFEGEELTPSWIRHAVYPSVLTMNHYLPGLMAVIYGGRTPYEAIAEIEGYPTSETDID